MTSFGDRLRNDYLLPPTPMAVQDANLIEGILPRDADPIISDALDIVEYAEDEFTSLFKENVNKNRPDPPSKKRKYDMVSYQRRRPTPITASSLVSMKKKLNRVSCCVNTETGYHFRELSQSTTGGSVATLGCLDAFLQGNLITQRTGDRVHCQGIEIQCHVSQSGSTVIKGGHLFLVASLDQNKVPELGDFKVFGKNCIYIPQAGRLLWHAATDTAFNVNGYFKKYIPLKNRLAKYAGASSDCKNGNLYFVYVNTTTDTENHVVNCLTKISFKG